MQKKVIATDSGATGNHQGTLPEAPGPSPRLHFVLSEEELSRGDWDCNVILNGILVGFK